MPCHAAILDKALVLKEETSIEKALADMAKKKTEFAAVTNKDGILTGFFSYQILMKNLLPVSIAMNDGIQIDMKLPAAPGIAKRLRKVMPLPIKDLMEHKNFPVVHPETPLWEGVNLLVQYGQPLCVIEPVTQKYLGIITQESALNELQRLQQD